MICALEAISWLSYDTEWLLSVLNGAIDVYDEMQHRQPTALVEGQWNALACFTST